MLESEAAVVPRVALQQDHRFTEMVGLRRYRSHERGVNTAVLNSWGDGKWGEASETPNLADRRPTGPVEQGPRDQPKEVDLAGMLRALAG